jgi:hypothetical protein
MSTTDAGDSRKERPTRRPRTAFLLAAFLVLLASGAWLAYYWRSPASPPHRPANGQEPENGKKPLEVCLPRPELADSPLPGRAGGSKLAKLVFECGSDGVCTFALPGTKVDEPMIEMRFFQRGPNGNLEPFWIDRFNAQRWTNGRPAGLEKGDFPGASPKKAKGFRSPAAPEGTNEIQRWRFGCRYYMVFWSALKGEDGKRTCFEAVIEVPKKIPRGKIAVIPVVTDYPWPELTRKSRGLRLIEGRITCPLPAPARELEVGYWGPEDYDQHRVFPSGNGAFSVKADKLGGMLRVTRRDRSGCGWAYIKSVRKRKLLLPAAADLLVEEKNLLRFDLVIPRGAVKPSLKGIMLKVHSDDAMPMCWAHVSAYGKLVDGAISMRFVPGHYWVEGLYETGEAKGDGRNFVKLGRVKVTKDSAGKRLTVVPPERPTASGN